MTISIYSADTYLNVYKFYNNLNWDQFVLFIRGETQSLFTTTGGPKDAPVREDEDGRNVLVLDDDGYNRRTTDQLQLIIKDLFSKQYKEVSKLVDCLFLLYFNNVV